MEGQEPWREDADHDGSRLTGSRHGAQLGLVTRGCSVLAVTGCANDGRPTSLTYHTWRRLAGETLAQALALALVQAEACTG